MEQLIADIILIEWNMFDQVKNEDGRARCQDDWETFKIMRMSQYLSWSDQLIQSYHKDIKQAVEDGRNLIMEKYAIMMESSSPEKYVELASYLPKPSIEMKKEIETIIMIQLKWMETFREVYPKMAGEARVLNTTEDTLDITSYETYLRGELTTYSKDTLHIYTEYVNELEEESKNLTYMIMGNTAQLYGYSSLEETEDKL